MRCSNDLRQRVIKFVSGGGSKAQAARRFQVSRTSVYTWVKAADALSYQKPGPKTGWKLDWEALRRQVEQQAELTLQERAQHFRVSRHGIWNALRTMGLTRKKNARLPRAQPLAPETVSAAS